MSSKAAKGATAADFDSGKATIGTGPWKFVRYIKGDRIELARNDNYWGPKPPWDKVTFRLITSDPSRDCRAAVRGRASDRESCRRRIYARLKVNKDITISRTTSQPHDSPASGFQSRQVRRSSPISPASRSTQSVQGCARAQSGFQGDQSQRDRRARDGRRSRYPPGSSMPEGFFGVSADLKPEPFDPEGAKKTAGRSGLSRRFRDHAARTQQPLRQRRPDRAGSRADADARGHRDQSRDDAVLGLRFTRATKSSSVRRCSAGASPRARRHIRCAR